MTLTGDLAPKAIWEENISAYIPEMATLILDPNNGASSPSNKEIKKYRLFDLSEIPYKTMAPTTRNKEAKGFEVNVAPAIRNGRTMIPIKYIAEALNMNGKWDSVARKVTLEDEATKIEILVNTKNIVVNGGAFVGDIKSIVQNVRVLLSIGNIIKALGKVKSA